MRRSRTAPIAALATAFAAALAVPSSGQTAPGTAFTLDVPRPCVAGECSVSLTYDPAQNAGPVTLEIDWDHAGAPEAGFTADARVRCSPAAAGEDAEPCTDASPPYEQAGERQVVVRVSDDAGAGGLAVKRVSVAPAPRDPCRPLGSGEHCGPGNGRQTPGGGGKVSHKGWPRITGIFWQVEESGGTHAHTGGPLNDEMLGHHGSDTIDGAGGHDVIWGDWDPKGNSARQRDVLRGGDGNDWIYPSHGSTKVQAGAGDDYVYAFYGRGTIDCGPGRKDKARVRLDTNFKVRNCERILHFCAFGSDGHGGCLKPGEHQAAGRRD